MAGYGWNGRDLNVPQNGFNGNIQAGMFCAVLCQICGLRFMNIGNLVEHLEVHVMAGKRLLRNLNSSDLLRSTKFSFLHHHHPMSMIERPLTYTGGNQPRTYQTGNGNNLILCPNPPSSFLGYDNFEPELVSTGQHPTMGRRTSSGNTIEYLQSLDHFIRKKRRPNDMENEIDTQINNVMPDLTLKL